MNGPLARCAAYVVLLLACAPRPSRAQDDPQSSGPSAPQEGDEPAPEPRKESAPKPQEEDEDEERPGLDPEADYLALADAPLFLPRSYLYWGTPVGPKRERVNLVFALEYALHLSVFNDLRDQALKGKSWAGGVTISFEGDLRMIAVPSRPVRMPSYRPTVSGQLFYIVHRPSPVVLSLRTGAFHYSNGQERCTVDESLPDDNAACEAALESATDPGAQLNRRSGNFSTNGWLLEGFVRGSQVNTKGVSVGQLTGGLSAAGNLKKGYGAMEPALRKLYGWGKLTAQVEVKKRFGWASMTVRAAAMVFPGSDGRVKPAAGNVEIVLGPYWLTGLGFFGRYYGGRDFYNAFFVDGIQQIAVGLAWDGERPLKFKRD